MTVTVYTLPHCVQCSATVRHLKKLGVDYVLKDARANKEALRADGWTSAPVVYINGREVASWAGYNPDRLNALARD